MKNEKLLILGKGFIGTKLYDFLKNKYTVYIKSNAELNYHEGSALSMFLLNKDIDVVINAAGFTGRPNVDEAEEKKELCWKLNVKIPLQINKLCNRLKINYIHISSGCIYNDYDKKYLEEDVPNFGLFDDSSFYSKTKHAFELMSEDLVNKIVRIRMPIDTDGNNLRNYLVKLKNYDNLIDYKNSKTYIPDLCRFMDNLIAIEDPYFWMVQQDIYNVVNGGALTTEGVVFFMRKYGYENKNWKFVDMEELNITAPRSNCVLNNTKACDVYKMRDEGDVLEEALELIQNYN